MAAVDVRQTEFIIRTLQRVDATRIVQPAKPLQPLLVLLGLAAGSWIFVIAVAELIEGLLGR